MHLNEHEVRALLEPRLLVVEMQKVLTAFSSGEVVQPVRSVVDTGRGFLAVMPAYLKYADMLGTKLVTVYEGNRERGLPSHQAMILLFDNQTGSLLATMDGRLITEMRTAAVSAVSVRALANPDARSVTIIGAGVQARSHVEFLRCVLKDPIFSAWSPNRDNLVRFAEDSNVHALETPDGAVRGADVIVLATSSHEPVIRSEWVKAGAHVVSVGACRPNQREMDPALIARSRLFVDSRAAAVKESGDIIMGGFGSHIAGEIGEVVVGRVQGRNNRDQITIFKSLGLAVEDVASARLVYRKASSG